MQAQGEADAIIDLTAAHDGETCACDVDMMSGLDDEDILFCGALAEKLRDSRRCARLENNARCGFSAR